MNNLILETIKEDTSHIYIKVSHKKYNFREPSELAEFLLDERNLIEGFGNDERFEREDSLVQHYYKVLSGDPNYSQTGGKEYYCEDDINTYMSKNKNAFSWVGEYLCKLVCSKYINKPHLVLASPIYYGDFSRGKISNINLEHTGADLVLLDSERDVLYVCEAKFYKELGKAVYGIKKKYESNSGFRSILDSSNDAYYEFNSIRNLQTGEKNEPNLKAIKKIFFVFVLHNEQVKEISEYSDEIETITFNEYDHNIQKQFYTSLAVNDKSELCRQIIKICMERK